jgi:hypothetical protein
MGISDVIFDTISDIIDGCVHYYGEHELLEIAENDDILEIVACHLKVDNRRSFYKITEDDLARIEAIDWISEAKKYILKYIEDNYLSDQEESEDESEDEKIKPYLWTMGIVKK